MNAHELSTAESIDQGGRSRLDHHLMTLSQPERRRILTVLAEGNPRDEDEFDLGDFQGDDQELTTFMTRLHHVHLPQLEAAGFIEWDRETETVQRGPRYDEIAPLVELMIAHRDELPANWL